MALFIGGPYHGRDLSINVDLVRTLRLPEVAEWDAQVDSDATVRRSCPYQYVRDNSTNPPHFRFVEIALPPKT